MLVLTRKLMEKIYIGEEICVTIVRLEGGQVRLGIDAPRTIPVVRAELRARSCLADTRADPAESVTGRRFALPGNDIRRREPSR